VIDRRRIAVRRRVLAPGEATVWHVDPCWRHTVVVAGERLRLEFLDGRAPVEVTVHAGMAEWDAPTPSPHRPVNAGTVPYEEVVMFLLAAPDDEPQPELAPACDPQRWENAS
jgi:hypothetical protein